MDLRRAWREGSNGIRDRLEHLVVHIDFSGRLSRVKRRIRDGHREKVSDAAGRFADSDEHRQIGYVEPSTTSARNISRREHPHDAWHRRRGGGANRQHSRPRMFAEHDRPVEHPGNEQVADEGPLAQGLLQPAKPRSTRSDPVAVALGPAEAGH